MSVVRLLHDKISRKKIREMRVGEKEESSSMAQRTVGQDHQKSKETSNLDVERRKPA